MSKTFALVIGIDDYSHFDPTGRNDLRGAVNDAHRWQGFLTGRLGVPADQARLLTSGDATRDAIRAGVAWLVEQLQTAGPDAAGLVTFSGHGAGAADTAQARLGLTDCLCPADVEVTAEGLLDHTISFANLQHWLQAHDDAAAAPRERLSSRVTVILDACYGVQTQGPRVRSLGATARADGEQRASEVTSRLLVGCQPWSESYELVAHERYHGAFTWCLLTLLERWTTRTEAGQTFVNVAYVDLVHRVRSMLDVLGVPQAPWMLGPPYASLLPFLRGAAELTGDATSTTPDEPLPGSQLESPTGSGILRLALFNGSWADGNPATPIAACIECGPSTAGPDGGTLPAGVENWYFFAQTDPTRTIASMGQVNLSFSSDLSTFPSTYPSPVAMMSRCVWLPVQNTVPPGVTATAYLQGSDSSANTNPQLQVGAGTPTGTTPVYVSWKKSGAANYVFGTSMTGSWFGQLPPVTGVNFKQWKGLATGQVGLTLGPLSAAYVVATGTRSPWGLGYLFRYCCAWLVDGVEYPLGPISVLATSSASPGYGTQLSFVGAWSKPAGTTVTWRVYRQVLNAGGTVILQQWQVVLTPANGAAASWQDLTTGS